MRKKKKELHNVIKIWKINVAPQTTLFWRDEYDGKR